MSAVPRFVTALLAVVMAVTSMPRNAEAQADVTSAREHFNRGVTALDEGRFADAAAALEESRRLRDAPVVNYNLGLAYRALGRSLDAIAAFDRYMANPGTSPPPGQIEAVLVALAQLRASTVTVRLHLEPASAAVHIDGRPHELTDGVMRVDPGDHVIEALAEGYSALRRQETFTPGQSISLDLRLSQIDGAPRLLVEPSVASAVIRLDGRLMPAGRIDLATSAGEHHVQITAPGCMPFERTVVVPRRGVLRVDANLSRRMASWVVPVVIGAGVLVVGGVIAAAVLANPGTASPFVGTLGLASEKQVVR